MRQKHFQVKAVRAYEPFHLSITFGDGMELSVDLLKIIERIPALAPLKSKELFFKAHVDEWGNGVSWIDDELDLAGDNLRAEAVEQAGGISHERIWEWMHRNGLTLDAAAEALGISRRMVAYYRNGEKTIPRHVWLACLGWERFVAEGDSLKKAA